MKKKIVALSLVVALVAIAIVGASLAYFTDKDEATNVFTVGNVDIKLEENFEQNSTLRPSTGSAQLGTLKNGVKKEVYVTNEGTEDAYVRVHIAIPAVLDDGDPSFDAKKNVLHFNYSPESIAEGKWDWSKSADDGVVEGNWNYYTTEIEGVAYNVYVVTYTSALSAEESTDYAIYQVYLDKKVTNHDVELIKEKLGADWEMHVIAEAAQAEGFNDAFEALNTAFGTPGSYNAFG